MSRQAARCLFILSLKGGLLKYFTIEQVVEALKTGAARRHQIYDNFAQARYRGFAERAALFKTALEIFDQWKKENKSC